MRNEIVTCLNGQRKTVDSSIHHFPNLYTIDLVDANEGTSFCALQKRFNLLSEGLLGQTHKEVVEFNMLNVKVVEFTKTALGAVW